MAGLGMTGLGSRQEEVQRLNASVPYDDLDQRRSVGNYDRRKAVKCGLYLLLPLLFTLFLFLIFLGRLDESQPLQQQQTPPVPAWPVILDTDIGDDIDDMWALLLLLRLSSLRPRLILTSYGNHTTLQLRARLVAKVLQLAGREDVPVALGVPHVAAKSPDFGQRQWLGDFSGGRPAVTDGVGVLLEIIRSSTTPITYISIGPTTTLAAALQQQPSIAGRVHYVGMLGSLYKGYTGQAPSTLEYNVRQDIAAARSVLSTTFLSTTLAPLDVCTAAQLSGPLYQQLLRSTAPASQALMKAYSSWLRAKKSSSDPHPPTADASTETSVLFDTVAVALAVGSAMDWLQVEQVALQVNASGFTIPDLEHSHSEEFAAVQWTDLGAFKRWLVSKVTT